MMLRADNRARALTISAAMIGGVALARATAKSRPDLSVRSWLPSVACWARLAAKAGTRGTKVFSAAAAPGEMAPPSFSS